MAPSPYATESALAGNNVYCKELISLLSSISGRSTVYFFLSDDC